VGRAIAGPREPPASLAVLVILSVTVFTIYAVMFAIVGTAKLIVDTTWGLLGLPRAAP
jgi:hypothetical protein